MIEPDITPLTVDDIRPFLPRLPDDECWDVSAKYSAGRYDRRPNLTITVGISSANGFYSRTWWECLRGVKKIARRRTWCSTSEMLVVTDVTHDTVTSAVQRLVVHLHTVRSGQRVIDGFGWRVC